MGTAYLKLRAMGNRRLGSICNNFRNRLICYSFPDFVRITQACIGHRDVLKYSNNSIVQMITSFLRCLLSPFYRVAHRRKRHVKPFCQIRHRNPKLNRTPITEYVPGPDPVPLPSPSGYVILFQIEYRRTLSTTFSKLKPRLFRRYFREKLSSDSESTSITKSLSPNIR